MLDGAARRRPRLLIEPTAGGGKALAATVEDLGPYFAALDDHPLVGVCFDTCHAWAAGHDLAAPGGMTATLDALAATVGPGRLGLVHANDSLDECGSKRDRHTTIGAGSIGVAPFAELLAHPSMAGVPVVVETPSELDGSPSAGHERDIDCCSLLPGAARTAAAASHVTRCPVVRPRRLSAPAGRSRSVRSDALGIAAADGHRVGATAGPADRPTRPCTPQRERACDGADARGEHGLGRARSSGRS